MQISLTFLQEWWISLTFSVHICIWLFQVIQIARHPDIFIRKTHKVYYANTFTKVLINLNKSIKIIPVPPNIWISICSIRYIRNVLTWGNKPKLKITGKNNTKTVKEKKIKIKIHLFHQNKNETCSFNIQVIYN